MTMPFQYARFGGVIEWFDFTMTGQEIIGKAACDSITQAIDPQGAGAVAEQIGRSVDQVRDLIYNQTREYPQIIRFFSLPNFQSRNFSLLAAARTANGATYIFGNDRETLKMLAPDGYDLQYLNKGLDCG
jgi:hypothetical protein